MFAGRLVPYNNPLNIGERTPAATLAKPDWRIQGNQNGFASESAPGWE